MTPLDVRHDAAAEDLATQAAERRIAVKEAGVTADMRMDLMERDTGGAYEVATVILTVPWRWAGMCHAASGDGK